jgi:hypothetical protein
MKMDHPISIPPLREALRPDRDDNRVGGGLRGGFYAMHQVLATFATFAGKG